MNSEDKKARALLRCKYLNMMKALSGRSATITTCEGNKLKCNVFGCDRDGEQIGVENLVTPTGTLSHAILRTGDLDIIELKPIKD